MPKAADPPRRAMVVALLRGLRKRCPRCGQGSMFNGWYTIRERCLPCSLPFEPRDGDTWAFMYLSTGFLTGLFIIAMLLIRPDSLMAGRTMIVIGAIVVIVGTLPYRKGLAVAVDYLTMPDQESHAADDVHPPDHPT